MNYTLTDIIQSRNKEKRKIDKMDLWVFIVVRPLSYLLTWILMRLRCTANQTTFLSFLIALIGSAFLFFKGDIFTFLGLIILNFWIVFDCVDGNIARTTKSSSIYGEFLDGVSGYAYTILLYSSIGVNIFINGETTTDWIFIYLGSMTSIMTIIPRLIEHKANGMFSSYKRESTDKNTYGIIQIIGLNIAGMAGLSNPLMIIAWIFDVLNIYIIFYFFIHTAIALITILKIIKMVRSIKE